MSPKQRHRGLSVEDMATRKGKRLVINTLISAHNHPWPCCRDGDGEMTTTKPALALHSAPGGHLEMAGTTIILHLECSSGEEPRGHSRAFVRKSQAHSTRRT